MQQFTFFAPEVDRAVRKLDEIGHDRKGHPKYDTLLYNVYRVRNIAWFMIGGCCIDRIVRKLNKLLINFENAVVRTCGDPLDHRSTWTKCELFHHGLARKVRLGCAKLDELLIDFENAIALALTSQGSWVLFHHSLVRKVRLGVKRLNKLLIDFEDETKSWHRRWRSNTRRVSSLRVYFLRVGNRFARQVDRATQHLYSLFVDFANELEYQGRFQSWVDGTYLIPNRFAHQVNRAVSVLLDIETCRRHNDPWFQKVAAQFNYNV